MGRFFQNIDHPHFDYRLESSEQMPGLDLRGPLPDLDKPYFVCMGATQVFGRFCHDPFPQLLSRAIDLPVLNLGIPGSGPVIFLEDAFLKVINRAQFAVVQVMSGRSERNSEFDNSASGSANGIRLRDGRKMLFDEFLAELIQHSSREDVARIVEETRRNWVAHYRELLSAINVPTVLQWFSTTPPRTSDDYSSWWKLLGPFPQLVNRKMIGKIIPFADAYVQTVSKAGLPQALWKASEAVNGTELYNGTLINNYYPSSEMHQAAFRDLVGVCKALTQPSARDEGNKEHQAVVISANELDGMIIAGLFDPGTLSLSYAQLLEDRGLLPFLAARKLHFIHVRRHSPLEGYIAALAAKGNGSKDADTVYVDPVAYATYAYEVMTAERRIARDLGKANCLEVFLDEFSEHPQRTASQVATFLQIPEPREGAVVQAVACLQKRQMAENSDELRAFFKSTRDGLPKNEG